MNADRLLAHFDTLVDTPGAVPRLRRFILDLAVRSKLVPQDPTDETASALLCRIAHEKRRMTDAGEIRRQKPRWEASAGADMPFSLPANWAWSRVVEIGVLNPRNSAPDDVQASFVPMSMIASEYGVPHGHEVKRWSEIKNGYTHFSEGDVGVAKITPCFQNGKSTIFRNLAGGMGSGTTELHIIRPLFVDPRYVVLFFKSSYFIEPGIPKMTGTAGQKRVPGAYFANASFPLPPLAEQHRIVAKVDELMTLCNRLEEARQEREAARDRFAATNLARLSSPDPDLPTFHADAAFAIENFDRITARADQVAALRRTILDLAVRGRLVPQDPTDEPASELLGRITKQRARMIDQGVIRKPRESLDRERLAGPFDIPSSWRWVRLRAVGAIVGGGTPAASDANNFADPGAGFPWLTPADLGRQRTLFIARGARDLTEQGLQGSSATPMPAGSVLFTSRAPVGYVAIALNPVSTNQGFKSIVPYIDECSRFIAFVLMAFAPEIDANAPGTTFREVSGKIISQHPFPLPPLAEQRRIVARVDEMTALCDRLEERLVTADDIRHRLFKAMLYEAVGARRAAALTRRVA